ncbi:zinc finger, CCHC-type containing protein [Tanacetum coccineum]|uniref:Zinc finger, CCHC-type containing protein n=1 Tax=Tanacetum coccineum TaxID=301880 RepID=A0ABQ5I837_9ASTR
MSYCSTAVEVLVYKGLRLVEIGGLNSSSKPSQPSKCAIVEIGEDCQHVKVLGDLRRGSGGEKGGFSLRNNNLLDLTSLIGTDNFGWSYQLKIRKKYLEQPILAVPVAAAPDQPIPPQDLATYNKTGTPSDCERFSHVQAGGRSILSLILVGLSKEYDSFVQNYNMHNMGKTVNELHVMLKLHEETLPKKVVAPALHAIRAGKVQKNKNKKPSKAAKGVQGKGNGKKAYVYVEPSYAPKPKNPPPPKKDNLAKDAICHYCGEVGCGTHICNTTQGLRGSKKLNPGALSLYMGNGQHAVVETIGNYHLCLPSRLVIVLNNWHYAPSITRGIISVSRLYEYGFINCFELNNAIFVSKNNIVYFTAIPRDGLYEIEMSCSNTNDSSMYVVSNKRAKLNLDSSLLWHCRLGHISKKSIEKLQNDGLLNSTDIESLGMCVSCMSGKMAWQENPIHIKWKWLKIYLDLYTPIQEFLDHLKEHGIISHRTPPYMPQHNGVLEKRNRTLLDMVHSMMSQTTLPKSFWDYALESAARILNMVSTKKVDKTPYEIWNGQTLKLSYLKVWGYEALVKRDTLTKPDKLEPRSFKCFFESNLMDQEANGSLKDLEIIQENDTNPSLDTSLNHEEDDQEIDEP